jgi:hypothetical protein
VAVREDRRSQSADAEVEELGRRPAAGAQECARPEHGERLQGRRNRVTERDPGADGRDRSRPDHEPDVLPQALGRRGLGSVHAAASGLEFRRDRRWTRDDPGGLRGPHLQ